MPLLHCPNCHHEWEGCIGTNCGWCREENRMSIGYVISKKTDLEKLDIDKILKELENNNDIE